jgi:hypothetical protein
MKKSFRQQIDLRLVNIILLAEYKHGYCVNLLNKSGTTTLLQLGVDSE